MSQRGEPKEDGEKQSDPWYILKTKPTGLADRLDVGCERQEVENDSHLPSK